LALSPSAAANRRIGLLKFKPEITPLSIPTNFAPLPCHQFSLCYKADMKTWNSDTVGDRLADLIVIALVSFFLWSVVRALGWY
jgi:hypothetical protein